MRKTAAALIAAGTLVAALPAAAQLPTGSGTPSASASATPAASATPSTTASGASGGRFTFAGQGGARGLNLTLQDQGLTLGLTEGRVQSAATNDCAGVACARAAGAVEPFGTTVTATSPGSPGPAEEAAFDLGTDVSPELTQVLDATIGAARAATAESPVLLAEGDAGAAHLEVTLTQTLLEELPEELTGGLEEALGAIAEGLAPIAEQDESGTIQGILDQLESLVGDLTSAPLLTVDLGPTEAMSTAQGMRVDASSRAAGAVVVIAPLPESSALDPQGLIVIEVGSATASATTDGTTGSATADPAIARVTLLPGILDAFPDIVIPPEGEGGNPLDPILDALPPEIVDLLPPEVVDLIGGGSASEQPSATPSGTGTPTSTASGSGTPTAIGTPRATATPSTTAAPVATASGSATPTAIGAEQASNATVAAAADAPQPADAGGAADGAGDVDDVDPDDVGTDDATEVRAAPSGEDDDAGAEAEASPTPQRRVRARTADEGGAYLQTDETDGLVIEIATGQPEQCFAEDTPLETCVLVGGTEVTQDGAAAAVVAAGVSISALRMEGNGVIDLDLARAQAGVNAATVQPPAATPPPQPTATPSASRTPLPRTGGGGGGILVPAVALLALSAAAAVALRRRPDDAVRHPER